MRNPPKTAAEAQQLRYARWQGNPEGHAYKPGYCAYAVPDGYVMRQCDRRAGKGPHALYCKQHARMVGGGGEGS